MGEFAERCYALLKTVPAGRVTTYADLARALGTQAYRAVGTAMNRNYNAPEVPCHRVVNSNGALGGFATGSAKKIKLLEAEGICIENGFIKNFDEVVYRFDNVAK